MHQLISICNCISYPVKIHPSKVYRLLCQVTLVNHRPICQRINRLFVEESQITMSFRDRSFNWNNRVPKRNFRTNWRSCSNTGNEPSDLASRPPKRTNAPLGVIKDSSYTRHGSTSSSIPSSSSSVSHASSSSKSTSSGAANARPTTIPTMEQLLAEYQAAVKPHFYDTKLKELDKPGMAVWHFKSVCSLLTEQSRQGLHSQQFRPPTYDYSESPHGWSCKLTVFHPYTTYFLVTQSTKKKAEEHACKQALVWLRDQDIINANLAPNFHSEDEKKRFQEQQKAPVVVKEIPMALKQEMSSFLINFESNYMVYIEDLIYQANKSQMYHVQQYNQPDEPNDCEDEFGDDVHIGNNVDALSFDVLSGHPQIRYTESDYMYRSRSLQDFITKDRPQKISCDREYRDLRGKMLELPIHRYTRELLDLITKNRVVVISGETGCGKTTQLPLMLFEEMIQKGRGSEFSMIVTQPRRLASIAISEHVAYQFGEETVGKSIGYRIRSDAKPPSSCLGGILFCTTGILMRKLSYNPDLTGVSHVIVDEVHERGVICDFTLMLLKRLLQRNSKLKVILMSASINADIFSKYYNAPVFNIPGRLYHVTNHYLPQIVNQLPSASMNNPSRRGGSGYSLPTGNQPVRVNRELVVDLIRHIDRTKPDGAILCFLPGWDDIRSINEMLRPYSNTLTIVPVHSFLPHSEQRLIFSKPPVGCRKVVLATNIAETSLTVPDVVYVIDPGLCKGMRYNQVHNVLSVGYQWISRANAIQRQGRAGRLQPGECFKLYDETTEQNTMDPYPIPEMLGIPLESVVMYSKLYNPKEKVHEFLSCALEAPSREALSSAIYSLKFSGILDEGENLTLLGKKVVHFTSHPKLSVALIFAPFVGVLDPILNIITSLSSREPFYAQLGEDRSVIREVKSRLCQTIKSDHLATQSAIKGYFDQFIGTSFYNAGKKFADDHRMSISVMKSIVESKPILGRHLSDSRLIRMNEWNDPHSDVNRNSFSEYLTIATLLCGLYPNIVVVREGIMRGDKIRKGYSSIDVQTNRTIRLVAESLLRDLSDHQLSTGFLSYFNSYYSEDARALTIRDASLITPLTFVLFAGNQFRPVDEPSSNATYDRGQYEYDGYVIATIDNSPHFRFRLTQQDFQLVLHWRKVFRLLTSWYIARGTSNDNESLSIRQCANEYFSICHRLLQNESTTI